MRKENASFPNPRDKEDKPQRFDVRRYLNSRCINLPPRPPLAEDELRGYKAIAKYRWGDENLWRRAAHLCTSGRFPFYRDGSTICARRSTIDQLIALQEHLALVGRQVDIADIIWSFDVPTGVIGTDSNIDGSHT